MIADLWGVLGTIVLAMASGAGGSALLELWWKPRQSRRKAGTLVLAEMLLNTELLLMQTHARLKRPKSVPGDFHMSTLGWETAADSLVDLPARTLKSLLLLYNRYRHLNSCLPQFDQALRDIQDHATGSPQRQKAERHADVIIDVFNTGIDAAIDHAKELEKDLFSLAGLKPDREFDVDGMKRKVNQLLSDRERRIRGPEGQDA